MLRVAVVFLVLCQGLAADTCAYPGGDCWKLEMQTCKDNTTFSLHGLWPQWKGDCGKDFDISALSSIQSDLQTYWASCPEHHDTDKSFWQHEWETHGSCSGMDELTFFKKGLELRAKYASTCDTNANECGVCLSKDFSTVQRCSGKTATVPEETNKKMQARDSPCCATCEGPREKYLSVDTTHGHCGECCMEPEHYAGFKIFEPNLEPSNGQSCSDRGYPKYDSTVTHGVGPVSMTLDLYDAAVSQVVV